MDKSEWLDHVFDRLEHGPVLGAVSASHDDYLRAIEADVGAPLPPTYHQFIMKYGGVDLYAVSLLSSITGRRYPVMRLYGESTVASCDVRSQRARYVGRMPQEVLPIGCDEFDNQFVLGVWHAVHGTVGIGEVGFWEHEMEPDERDWQERSIDPPPAWQWSNIARVAGDFRAFLASLRSTDRPTGSAREPVAENQPRGPKRKSRRASGKAK